MTEYQWYPGHMTKARREMEENLKLIDLVIELADARLPESSRNPDIGRMCQGKSRVLILGKADLADPVRTNAYVKAQEEKGITVLPMDARNRADAKTLRPAIQNAVKARVEKDRKRGILNRPVRAMIAGIPNVGKSTLINSLAGRSAAKTGNKPGVTKGRQWISVNTGNMTIQLMDTPGILWPKFEDREVGIRLSVVRSINDDILDEEDLAVWLLRFLEAHYPDAVSSRYGIEVPSAEGTGAAEVLKAIGEKRAVLGKGGEPDLRAASHILLDDFRNGRLGRITLEF